MWTQELEPPAQAEDAFAAGARVRFDLHVPCTVFTAGLQCAQTEGYILVRPYASAFAYEHRCSNGHSAGLVRHAEVAFHFGLPQIERGTAAADPLRPSRRVAFNTVLRDGAACVICARGAGEIGLDGKSAAVRARPILPLAAGDEYVLRLDRELLRFARDVQLVTVCEFHDCGRESGVPDFEQARGLFVRVVLKGRSDGFNCEKIALFERLCRLVRRGHAQVSHAV